MEKSFQKSGAFVKLYILSSEVQPIVDEGELGIVIQPLNCFDFVLSVVHRTQETRTGITDFGGHSWGHLQLGYHWF